MESFEPCRVLVFASQPAAALRMEAELQQAGVQAEFHSVSRESDFLTRLSSLPDLVICEEDVPPHGAVGAMELLKARSVDVPLLIVSARPELSRAVEATRRGAADFLAQDRLSETLGNAVAAALQRKQIQAQRQMAEHRHQTVAALFRNVVEHSLVGVQILQDGKYVYANRKLGELFGYTEAELLALDSWTRVVAEEDREMVLEQVRRRVNGEIPHAQYVFRGLRKDGTVIDVEVRSDRTELNGRPAVIGTLVDTTERRRAEISLRDSEERFRSAFEHTNVAMVLTDLENRFIKANAAFAELFGYSAAEILTLTMAAITHPDHLAESYVQRRQLLSGDRDYFQMEKRYLRKDGKVLWGLTNVSLLRDTAGSPRMYVGQIQDITERKHAEAELKNLNQTLEIRIRERTAELSEANAELAKASQAKSEFLATMSHELRTPLNGILGMNELLLTTTLNDRQRQYVNACNSSGKALVQLINDILDLSKIEAGKLELDLRECDLEALIYDVAEIMSHAVREKGLALHCRLTADACVVGLYDDSRLRQILVNLVSNAIKFTPAGSITITAERVAQPNRSASLRIAVSDTGIGIPEERLDRLFKAFSQVDSSTTRCYGGTGLGLSICKQLVNLMGGKIGVESQVGVGTTFWFEIDFETIGELTNVERRRRLLVGTEMIAVDGLDRERWQLGESLRNWGCPFVQVATVAEALQETQRDSRPGGAPRVILADCRLVTGHEFEQLQQLAELPNLHIIGLGLPADALSREYLYGLGVRHILPDPIRPSALFNALVSVLAVSGRDSSATHADSPAVASSPVQLAGHILVAEDNHINQLYIVELLKYLGCTCDVVVNGVEVLSAVQHRRYDLLLMDCQMPEMDGFTAAREIRRREATGQSTDRLSIVALTANALKRDRERCFEAGMDDYVSKPVESGALHAVLAKYLGRGPEPTDPA